MNHSFEGLPRSLALCIVTAVCCTLVGCTLRNYGDEFLKLRRATEGKDVMWMPTDVVMAHEMLSLAEVKAEDIVYDLGSGDGIIPIEAARKFKARAVGIEYNPDLVELSKRNAQRAKLSELVTFRRGDIFFEDFSEATVVTLYLGESLNDRLMPQLLKMRPGTRIVSNTFKFSAWIPDRSIRLSSGDQASLWIVPAQINGLWVFEGFPEFESIRLRIRQKKQFFDGTLEGRGRPLFYVEDGQIEGNNFRFKLLSGGKTVYSVVVVSDNDHALGTISDGNTSWKFKGRRVSVK